MSDEIHSEVTELLTPQEVAARLRVSRAWVYRNRDQIGFRQIGGAVRFSIDDIEAYLERSHQPPQPAERSAPGRPGPVRTRSSSKRVRELVKKHLS